MELPTNINEDANGYKYTLMIYNRIKVKFALKQKANTRSMFVISKLKINSNYMSEKDVLSIQLFAKGD